ncbi:MAG: L,D-transpeptidase family protein [Hyphomicrobiales bacterium]|nr:L,D-transpeptidase family protein [Hyphomicrobiales bacterium]MCP4999673.1 L,D-transpeptidase family protein [Hyphomicrobiales bacterium]
MRKSLVVLACVFTVGAVLPTTAPPAFAQNGLFEVIFGKKQRTRRQRQRELERIRTLQAAQPAPKVKGPSFYTYKPDVLKSVDLSDLAKYEVVTTEPVVNEPSAASVEPASIDVEVAPVEPVMDDVEVASVDPVVTEGVSDEPVATDAHVVSDEAATSDDTVTSDDQAESVKPIVEEPVTVSAFDESRGFLEGYKIKTLKEVGAALMEHYKANPEFIWVADNKPNDRSRAVLAAMAAAREFGLSATDYSVEVTEDDFDASDMDARRRELIQFEMRMSATALNYILDATRGRIDPNRLSGYHDFKRKDVDLPAALSNLAASDDVGAYLVSSNPSNRQFKVMMEELAKLREVDADDHIEIAEGTFLKVGRSSPELEKIVAAIRKRGSDELLVNHGITFFDYDASGGELYTPELVVLVKDFQREKGLAADGIIGKMTIGKLTGMSNQSKIDKLVLAMERLRWLPRNLGSRHVFINQPAFRATYVKNDKDAISMRVVVGKRSNQTSFFQDEIETVEYNPYWGVPRSIIVNEMLPKLRQDPSYLDRLGYELTDRRGRRVSSRNVNWYSVGTNTVPVDVRQPPGRRNALGELKILFPNKHAIYMHDTPAKKLFERDARAFSHGCVRLQDPRGMAAAVLGKSREHIAQQIAQGQNMAEPVAGNIPVYVSYFTAWPNEDGTVGYYADMYGRDKHLDKAIERTRKSRDARG